MECSFGGAHGFLFLILGLALIYFLSQALHIVFDRFKLPSVVSELICGVLLAVIYLFLPEKNFLHEQIGFLKNSEIIKLLGELGIIILLLEVGLETELKQILSAGKESVLVATGGVLAPFLLAGLFCFLLFPAIFPESIKFNISQVLFIGLVFAATSIGVTARVFQELNLLRNFNAQVVLGAAVLDDILGLILLSIILGIVKTGSFEIFKILQIILASCLFMGFAFYFNPRVTSNSFPLIKKLGKKDPLVFFIWILILCFIFSATAELLGLAGIIGSFTLGATLDSVKIKNAFGENKKVEDYIAPLRAFLLPIFFVQVGLSIQPQHIFSLMSIILTILACVSKISSGWLLLPFKTNINRLLVGVGMMPRGEVGLVILALGSKISGIFTPELYSGLLVAIILTTIISPIWLQKLSKNI